MTATRALACAALLCLLAGCVDLAPARNHAHVQAAANEGHAADASLPPQARSIGRVNADAWAAQLRYLGED